MAVEKTTPFDEGLLDEIVQEYGTPVFVYEEAGIRASAQRLNAAFSWSEDYVNHFAVKATPTPAIMRVLEEEGMGFDASSRLELRMLDNAQLGENGIFYTSNNTPDRDYQYAHLLDATINVDKLPYIEQVRRALGDLPMRMVIRYNPGTEQSNDLIGTKFGDTEDHVLEGLALMKKGGVDLIGLHAMVVTNETDPEAFGRTAQQLRVMAEKAMDLHGVEVELINIGGGLGVNYRPDEEPVDVEAIGQAVEAELGDTGIRVVSENGRHLTGPHGYLVSRVTHGMVEGHETLMTIDASVNSMPRLKAGGYHHITFPGHETAGTREMTVVGSMCANTDRMYKGWPVPDTLQPGDLAVMHDVGAHVRANAGNYNLKTIPGEVLVSPDGSHRMVQRHEEEEDLFATITEW